MWITKNRKYNQPDLAWFAKLIYSCIFFSLLSPSLAHATNGDLEITLFVDLVDTICIEDNLLPGDLFSLEINCDEGLGDFIVAKVIDTTCFTLLGLQEGEIELCAIQCNEEGLCDTTFLLVTITTLDAVLPLVQPDTLSLDQFSASAIQVLANDLLNGELDTIYIGILPQFGIASLQTNGQLAYTYSIDDCNEGIVDSLQYVVCNPFACGRGWVYINLICDDLVVYNGFSPNDDGINDYFIIQGIEKYQDHTLQIFNRWGALVFESSAYSNDWNGSWAGAQLPDGTYFYVLQYGRGRSMSGYLQINR